MIWIMVFVCSVALTSADVSHLISSDPYQVPYDNDHYTTSTPPPPPRPYAFKYAAGRYPGHIDRQHAEVSDGSGTVRGAFSYIAPGNKIQSVEYVADKNGFHPVVNDGEEGPQQSEAVLRATQRHAELYNRIATSHAHYNPAAVNPHFPRDSAAVAHAKERHYNLYDAIAQQHARIGAEQAELRRAYEATSEHPEYDNQHY